MKRFALLTFFLCFTFVVIGPMESKSKKKSEYTIVIDQSLSSNYTAMAAWFSYAGHINSDMEVFAKNNPSVPYVTPFLVELESRKSMIKSYQEMLANIDPKQTSRDEYLDDVIKIIDAGYMTEYVYFSFNTNNWALPEGIREKEYQDWMLTNLPNHLPKTLAIVRKNE